MIPLWTPAWADEPAVVAETAVELRHDVLGQAFVPLWQTASVSKSAGGVRVDGLAAVDWGGGVDGRPDPDLLLMQVAGDAGRVSWTAGRQRLLLPFRPQTLDGASAAWKLTDSLSVDATAGYARHMDLDDFLDGTALGRIGVAWRSDALHARVGAWAWVDAVHPEAELGWRSANGPQLHALVVGELPDAGLSRARIEGGTLVVPGLRATAHVEHREPMEEDAPMGESILGAFAPGGVQEAGIGLRGMGPKRALWTASYAATTWMQGDRVFGHRASLGAAPAPLGAVALGPSLSSWFSPGGWLVAGGTSAKVALGDATRLDLEALGAPYQKPHLPVAVAAATGVSLLRSFGKHVAVEAGGDLVHDAVFDLEIRGHAAVTVSAW